jgi:hypothetical protein
MSLASSLRPLPFLSPPSPLGEVLHTWIRYCLQQIPRLQERCRETVCVLTVDWLVHLLEESKGLEIRRRSRMRRRWRWRWIEMDVSDVCHLSSAWHDSVLPNRPRNPPCLSVHLSVCLSVYLSISISLPICLPVYVSVGLSVAVK